MVSRETWRDVSPETSVHRAGPGKHDSAKQPHASKNIAIESMT
jgi:hypothetical protein